MKYKRYTTKEQAEMLLKARTLLANGMTRTNAAKELGIALMTLSKWETQNKPTKARKTNRKPTITTVAIPAELGRVCAFVGSPKEIAEILRQIT